MKDIREQPKPNLDVKFHDERKLVVVSGADEPVLDVYRKILIEKRRSEAEADYLVDEARAFLKGQGEFEPESTTSQQADEVCRHAGVSNKVDWP